MSQSLRIEKFVKAAPAQVYTAFTNATSLRDWLCDLATTAPRPGGRLYLWWHSDFYSAGEYTALDENRSIAFTWFGRGDPGPSPVKVTLEPKGGGTHVVLVHEIPAWKNWKGSAEEFRREWAASLENLASVLETGLDQRFYSRPMLGIIPGDFNAEQAKALGVPVKDGIRLDGVVAGMGAAACGLRRDDVIVSMAGKAITNDPSSLPAALAGKKGGEQVEVVFYRGAEKKNVIMTLSKRPVPEVPFDAKKLAAIVRARYEAGLAELLACFAGVSEAEASKRPAPGEWSAKETLAHLIHSERGVHAYMDDMVGGQDRWADDWGGNVDAHIQATLRAYPTLQMLLEEFKRLCEETLVFIELLPVEFIARRNRFFNLGGQMVQGPLHTTNHIEQIQAALAAAKGKK